MSIDEKKSFLNYTLHPAQDPILRALEEAVTEAPDMRPSQLAGDLLAWLFTDGFIPECCREDFFWTLDTMQDWMFLRDMTCETERRSRHPRERARRIRCVINNFVHDPLNETPLEVILTDPDMRYERREDLAAGRAPMAVNYRLAAAIDRGDQRIIALVEDSIGSLSGQPAILLAQDWRLEMVIRAALRCRNPMLHQAVARRAAQMTPQETKRFVQVDLGRREALIAVLAAMADSGVMDRGDVFGHGYAAEVIEQITKLYCARFSSHIPANMHHLLNRHGNGATMKSIAHIRDYITSDTVRTALRCLTEPAFRAECLRNVHDPCPVAGEEGDLRGRRIPVAEGASHPFRRGPQRLQAGGDAEGRRLHRLGLRHPEADRPGCPAPCGGVHVPGLPDGDAAPHLPGPDLRQRQVCPRIHPPKDHVRLLPGSGGCAGAGIAADHQV